MSTAVGSGKRPNVFNEETEALYDPYFGSAVNNAFAQIPWPEWNDAELNAEVWEEAKGGRASTALPKNLSLTASAVAPAFEDSNPPELPPPVAGHVRAWKRPQEVFPGALLTVYEPTNAEFELHVPSTLSLGWNFFKAFIEHLNILQFYAVKYGFHVEGETANFASTTQGEAWRPWHHVYAMCKAGKGQVHKPLHCPFGKYVLRLFYMGAWRRFVVDDRIPCDVEGNCMLPITQIHGELWPIVLAKGLLKILSLTPADDFSVTDFPLVSAFTGWTRGYFVAENKTADQVWRRLQILAPRYEQSDKTPDAGSKNALAKIESSKRDSRKSTDRDESKSERFCLLFGDLWGFSYEEEISVDCTVAIMMTRDCPIVKATKREGTKPWKRLRWIYWAKEKGLWSDENQLPPYRRLQIITFLPELGDLLLPDPKLEAAMFDIPLQEDTSVEDELSTEDSKLFEPEQWCDYFRFLDYLTGVNVFFKPSYLVYNFKVTCLRERVRESLPAGKGTSKAPAPPSQNLFIFPTVLRQTGNEPIYLLCEAITGIFLCLSLWVSPQEEKNCFGYLETDQPKILKVGRASVVIEQFDWRLLLQGEIIGLVKTVGCSSTVLNLKPGRHVLKLWHFSDSPYVLDIYSNANVVLSKSPKLRFLMNAESQQILQYVNNVSNSFTALAQKFGKPELTSALRDFYDTIKPKNDSFLNYYQKLDDFIESFLNCIVLTLKDLIPNTDEVTVMTWALRSLFVNPDIRCDLPSVGSPSIFGGSSTKKAPQKVLYVPRERTLSELLKYITLPEEIDKIISVQKVFRGYRVRLLWKCQTAARKEFKPFAERLKKICDAVFAPPKREVEVGKLLRRIVTVRPDLLPTFRFHKDFSNVLEVEEFTGKIPNAEPFAWVPIARFVIACHREEPVSCGFYLSCNLEQSVIQGFDNDAGEEVFRLTNTVSPHYYRSNVKGYTILVFGWNEANVKTVNWRLEMVKMKHFQSMHLCNLLISPTCQPYLMPSLDVLEVRNFYIPNSKSRIFRCLIKIQKRTLLTLRLSLSYSEVQFVVIISLNQRFNESNAESDHREKIVAQMSSRSGAVILPSLVLEHVEMFACGESDPESDPTEYVVEAYVLNDSWPLTKQEWGLVEPLRVNGENWKESVMSFQSKRGGSESRKKLQRTSRRSPSEQKIENPFWLLQALNDSTPPESSAEAAVIEEDKSYAEYVRAMKLSWEEQDPGRRNRGKEFRKDFLYVMHLEEKKRNFYFGEDDGETCRSEKSEDVYEDPQFLVDRLASFSYLTNDPSPTRYIYSPRVLPSMPLDELLCKYKRMAESDSSSERTHSRYSESATEISYRIVDDLVEDMEDQRRDYLSQCVYYRSVVAAYLNDEQKLSNQLMEQAYEARLKFIERMTR